MQSALNNMVKMGYLTEEQRDELYFKGTIQAWKFHFEENMLIDIVSKDTRASYTTGSP